MKYTTILERLRSHGYTLPQSLAELADNSITHNAKNIWVYMFWSDDTGKNSFIMVVDDGNGMSEDELLNRALTFPDPENIDKGEKVSLIGSNGAGKTTFMNMVTGYLKPDTGHIYLKNEEITQLDPRIITQKGISRSFQIPQIFEPMTAWENLLIALGTSQKKHSYFTLFYK